MSISAFELKQKAIEKRFEDNYTATNKLFANQNVTQQNGSWARLTVLPGNAFNAELGIKRQRYYGLIVVQLFVKENAGVRAATSLADTVATIFGNQQFDGITCKVPQLRFVGVANSWFQANVSFDFFYDVIS